MNTVWFLILCGMIAVYAVLDGFDLGIGSIILLVTKNEEERQQVLESIGPVWNGNEVWLLAAGGVMVAAFPGLYAAGFSGFYLPLMVVLWLFIGRGIGYEFRHFEKSPMWTGASDAAFSVASLLLTLIFGVAVGNVLRGVPLDASGSFTGAFAFLLNPFALVAGLMTVVILAMHGAAYIAFKTSGELKARATKFVGGLWAASAVFTILLIAASFFVRPDFVRNYMQYPWLATLPILALAAMVWIPVSIRKGSAPGTFLGTVGFIVGLLGSAAAGIYPRMLQSTYGSGINNLTIYNTAAGDHSLHTALISYGIGICFVAVYMIYIYRMANKSAPAQA